jgi:hypothetical protein
LPHQPHFNVGAMLVKKKKNCLIFIKKIVGHTNQTSESGATIIKVIRGGNPPSNYYMMVVTTMSFSSSFFSFF